MWSLVDVKEAMFINTIKMFAYMHKETTTVSILVNATKIKDVRNQQIVSFTVCLEGNLYRAIPMMEDAQRMQAALPEVISFSFVDHCIISQKPAGEETMEI